MISTQYPNIRQAQNVPYYEETQKRTLKQKLQKIRNTVYMLLAYSCPNNTLRQWMHRRRGVYIGKNVYLGTVHGFCLSEIITPFSTLYPKYKIPDPIRIISESEKKLGVN